MTIQDLARELADAFERRTRETGHDPGLDHYTTLRDGSPEWMTDVCRQAHDDARILPDDWRYEFIADAAQTLADADLDDADLDNTYSTEDAIAGLTEYVYTSQITGWLHSHPNRSSYVDEALAEFGGERKNIIDALTLGMRREQEEVLEAVYAALNERVDGDA